MTREKLFKKYYKNPSHDYEISETLQYEDDTGRKPDIAFIYSGRNRGKSFEISSQLIADAWYDKKLFGYIRRNDATTYDIEQYFADKNDFIKDMTDGKREGITRYKGKLYFYHMEATEDEEFRMARDEECGYFFALSRNAAYKSLQYPEIYNLIYEEVLTDGMYLNAEPEKLMNLYSTVKRNKTDFMMWLVSNTVSIVNPYSLAWSIKLAQNKPGDIRLSKLYLGSYNDLQEEEYLLIACHYLKDKGDISKEDLKKNRNRIKTGIASNRWDETTLYPTLPYNFLKGKAKKIDKCIFEWDDIMFMGDIMEVPNNIHLMYRDEVEASKETMPIIYIQRKTTPPFLDTRLYTNNPERFGPYFSRGFKMIYKIDKVVDILIQRGYFFGADNLTLNDFAKCFLHLKNTRSTI